MPRSPFVGVCPEPGGKGGGTSGPLGVGVLAAVVLARCRHAVVRGPSALPGDGAPAAPRLHRAHTLDHRARDEGEGREDVLRAVGVGTQVVGQQQRLTHRALGERAGAEVVDGVRPGGHTHSLEEAEAPVECVRFH